MNVKGVSDAFFNSFNSNHVILYVGQNSSNEELREYISKCAWSAVITSRRDPELAMLFASNERTPYEYSRRADIPAKPLSRRKLPIIRLFGVQGEKSQEEDLSWLQVDDGDNTDSVYDMYQAREFLEFLPEMLDHVNPLVVIGANSDIDWQIFAKPLNEILYKKVTDGSVTIWDMPEQVEEKYEKASNVLRKVAQGKKFLISAESLATVIKTREEDVGIGTVLEEEIPEYDTDIYYHGRQSINISQSDLLMFKNVGMLLTERSIHKIRPLGRVMSRKWFANFLEASTFLGPQWYGYLPQSTFYVKRSYEDALVQIVRKMLDGRDVTGATAPNRPIILAGDPGSSKSITLGALAYRIFNEKVHPVIYISKDSFLSANIGTGFDELDEALQFIEKNTDTGAKILVIWDSSAYKAGVDRAQSLMKRLQNRGRSFVLVCSSYSMYNHKDETNNGMYCLADSQTGRFDQCNEEQAQVYDRFGCYFVKAVREMNSKEQDNFWQRAKEYSGINELTLSQFRKKLQTEGREEIFDYYYLLISVLRENLEKGLQSEQNKVYPYVEKELQKAIGDIYAGEKKEKTMSPMYLALLNAGLDPDKFISDEEKEPEAEEIEQKLDLFNMCVALFSRFKLSVPYSLAYTLLLGERRTDQYSVTSRNLYKVVTTEIPWIHYGEDENGEFSFRFRNPLEADIFLRNHDFTGEQQIDLLCEIIDIYGTDYRRSKCKDLVFTDNLQTLLRLMGPNSGYTPFLTSRRYEHESILSKLDLLIDKLEDLRDVYGVPDEDAGFASIIVTFSREYYGSIWNKLYSSAMSEDLERWDYDPTHFSEEDYEFRIKKLTYAIALAEHSAEDLEQKLHGQDAGVYGRQHLINHRYSLAVEIAQCNMRLEEVIDEYKRCCESHGNTPDSEYTSRKLSYQVLYRQLKPVITSNPTNGYAYNALFKAFEKMYEKESLSEAKKIQYLSEIMQIVETCETLDSEIVNRGGHGADELTDHINRIKDLSTGLQITLQSIRRHRRGEAAANDKEQVCFELYDEMLEANNAAAITFICQKELRIPRGRRELDTDQLLRCRSVYEFMKEPDNFECVCSNAYALAMMIRVCWMLYNETTLVGTPECQLTRLKRKEWLEINKLCGIYNDISGDHKQPLLILLYALSALQISDLAEYGYQEALDILGTIDEDMFYQSRMWTPFMICDEDGKPFEFTGTVLTARDNGGFIRVNGVPQRLKADVGVRFRRYNLGRNVKMPEEKQALGGLELGIGYTTFSVYTAAGRREREGKS